MDNSKWLKRKYPDSFEELNEYFDSGALKHFKKSTLKIGRLTSDIFHGQEYKKGSILTFRRSNPVNDYNHPLIYAILKCQAGYTASGYHSLNVTEKDFIEIIKI